jgi:hypothetical protein
VPTRAEEYRAKALECEERAEQTRDSLIKQELLAIAQKWRHMADHAEKVFPGAVTYAKGQLLSPLRDRWKIIVAMDRLLAHMLATAKHERYRGERYGDQRSEGGAKTLWCFGCHHDLRLSALMANACNGSRFLHRQHIEKLSKDKG